MADNKDGQCAIQGNYERGHNSVYYTYTPDCFQRSSSLTNCVKGEDGKIKQTSDSLSESTGLQNYSRRNGGKSIGMDRQMGNNVHLRDKK